MKYTAYDLQTNNMKTLNLSFSDGEFRTLRKAYEHSASSSWREFFLNCAEEVIYNIEGAE